MNDERTKPAGPGSPDIEGELGRFAAGPVPPGLRERVLARAVGARKGAALAPWMRTLAVACSIVIAAVLLVDPLVGGHEAARLAALLDGKTAAVPLDEEAMILAEVVGGTGGAAEAARIARLEIMAASAGRKEKEHQAAAARRWLKGWLNNETTEDLE